MLVLPGQHIQHSYWKQDSPEPSDYQTYLTTQSSSNRAPFLTDLGAENLSGSENSLSQQAPAKDRASSFQVPNM